MNSKSKSLKCEYCKPNPCKCAADKDIDLMHLLYSPMLLSCSSGNGLSIFPNTSTPITIASITIDTTCLCKPVVKIDFNSTINYQAFISGGTEITPFTLIFELSKFCDDGTKVSLGSWTYSIGFLSAATDITNSFNFTYCECTTCSACFVYTVDIVKFNNSILSGGGSITEKISIITSNLSALATSS
ncbi:DUF4489 domain-containing protein [Clostridium sp. UBA6640]|uniref:DUF4489 domain-containing protein n=1 Tax=Clostridium sp. UBA6640 TaxID=1946370 RepID=UPI0025BDD5DC|nr:DUF4489 domain-containing protein [Clostridium sp. UBA6640]